MLHGGEIILLYVALVIFMEVNQANGDGVVTRRSSNNANVSAGMPYLEFLNSEIYRRAGAKDRGEFLHIVPQLKREIDREHHGKFLQVDFKPLNALDMKYRSYMMDTLRKGNDHSTRSKRNVKRKLTKRKRRGDSAENPSTMKPGETTESPDETVPTFYMLVDEDDQPLKEDIITVFKDEVFVTCFKERKGDGKFSTITMFVNGKEIAEDELITLMHSDAHESTVLLKFNADSDKEEDKKKTVKCVQSKDDIPEEIMHTFVAPAPAGKIDVKVSSTEYKNMEMVKVTCTADGNPPPPVDIAYYTADCKEAHLPQPLLIVTAGFCYVTPPACVQCTIQQNDMERSEGTEQVKSRYLVMRTETATSGARRNSSGSMFWLFFWLTATLVILL